MSTTEEGYEEKTLEDSYQDNKVDENENRKMIWYDDDDKQNTSKVKEKEENWAIRYVTSRSNQAQEPLYNPAIHYGNATEKKETEQFPLVQLSKPKEDSPDTVRYEEPPQQQSTFMVNTNKPVGRPSVPLTSHTIIEEPEPQEERPTTLDVAQNNSKPTVHFDEVPHQILSPPPIKDKDKEQQLGRRFKPPVPLPNILKRKDNTKPSPPSKKSPDAVRASDIQRQPPPQNEPVKSPNVVQVIEVQHQPPVIYNEPPPQNEPVKLPDDAQMSEVHPPPPVVYNEFPSFDNQEYAVDNEPLPPPPSPPPLPPPPPPSLTVNDNDSELSYGQPPDIALFDLKEQDPEESTQVKDHRFDNTIEEAPINFKVNANENEFEVGHSFDLDPKESEGYPTLNSFSNTQM